MSKVRRWLVAVTALAALAGACSDSGSDSEPSTTERGEESDASETETEPPGSGGGSSGEIEIVSPIEAAASGQCSSPSLDAAPSAAGSAESSDEGAAADGSADGALTANEIVDGVGGGVVIVTAIGPAADDEETEETDESATQIATETGSGAVIDDEGLIVTNRHVVESASVVVVQGTDNRIRDAAVVAMLRGDNDLALLRVEDVDGLVPIELGSSDDVETGGKVVALGSPVGVGLSVSVGVLSGRDRNIKVEDAALFGLLQTDAAINPGNSGGPLVDGHGRLIGVNTAVADAEGVGFAVPVEQVNTFVEAFESGGAVPTTDMQIDSMTPDVIAKTGAPVLAGVRVVAVDEGGPASDAGLVIGDVITEANGAPMVSVEEMNAAVADVGVDGTLELLVCRQAAGGWSEIDTTLVVGGEPVATQ